MNRIWLICLGACLLAGAVAAQRFGGRGGRSPSGSGSRPFIEGGGRIIYTEGGVAVDENAVRTAREIRSHSTDTPMWTNAIGFEKDVFTFARIRRAHIPPGTGTTSLRAGFWFTDFPDSDLDLSWRLSTLTSMKVDPDGRVLNLTDPDLQHYPWIYMVEPGTLRLREEEVPALRRYLLTGGVLMADDFWGQVQWDNFAQEIKRALPDRDFQDLPLSHPIFHCVFDIKGSNINQLQTPNFGTGEQSQFPPHVTWEYHDGEECRDVHVRAILDDKQRIMVIATHNTDNGDGWEREGEYQYFFRTFSEKRAYPLGVNIVFYLMTH
jgi:hypothetical protein